MVDVKLADFKARNITHMEETGNIAHVVGTLELH